MRLALWLVLALLSLLPWVSSPLALFSGAVLGLTLGNPKPDLSRKLTQKLLMISVIGLGAGMDLRVVAQVGAQGILYTAVGITLTLLLGLALGRLLGSSPAVSTLVSVGTAICGGSAIAAVAPVIKAKHHDVTVALATVFLLNASALLLFPWLGHQLDLSERAFGLWSALAIHDTSSVVGATMQYGRDALETGATVKLARALWIVPVTLVIAWMTARKQTGKAVSSIKVPWFIGGFVLMAALVTFVPALQEPGHAMEWIARRGLVLTLFLIGSNLTRESLKTVGIRPLAQGIALWAVVAGGTLMGIRAGWITP